MRRDGRAACAVIALVVSACASHRPAPAPPPAPAPAPAPAPPRSPADLEADLARGWSLLQAGKNADAIAILRPAAIAWRAHAEKEPGPAGRAPCAPGPATRERRILAATDPYFALARSTDDAWITIETCKGLFAFDGSGDARWYAPEPENPVFLSPQVIGYDTGFGKDGAFHVLSLARGEDYGRVDGGSFVSVDSDGRFVVVERAEPHALEVHRLSDLAPIVDVPLAAEDRNEIFFPYGDHDRARPFVVSPDGTRGLLPVDRAAPFDHGAVVLVDLEKGVALREDPLTVLGASSVDATPAFFSPKGDLELVVEHGGAITVADAVTGKTKAKSVGGCGWPTNVAKVTADQKTLVVGAGRFACGFALPSLASLFRTTLLTEKEYDLVDLHADVSSLAFVANDAGVLVESYMRGVVLLRLPTGAIAWRSKGAAELDGDAVSTDDDHVFVRFDAKLAPVVGPVLTIANVPRSDDDARALVELHSCAIGGWILPGETCP